MKEAFYSYGRQTIEQDDINAVTEVLKSDWLTQGPKVRAFEEDLAAKFGAKYVSAVANGTAGLHLIGLALGWKKDDIIITAPITFLASANCILYCGATPDFVDINRADYTIDVEKLEDKILKYKSENKKVKAVVAVDYAGYPCDWKRLRALADKYNFQLVNDNCHAPGAGIDGDIGYACKYADVVNMSFHPVKHITTGEGGAVLTDDAGIDEKIKTLRTHGITKDEKYLIRNDGPWYYEMHQLGFNYRITDFQAALGSTQLNKLERFVNKRREIAAFYDEQFANDERFIIPAVSEGRKHAYHLYPLQVRFDRVKIAKPELFEKLREKRIGLQVHYVPVHIQPYYRKNYGFSQGDFPVAEEFYSREISIPVYPQLNSDDLKYIVKVIKELTV